MSLSETNYGYLFCTRDLPEFHFTIRWMYTPQLTGYEWLFVLPLWLVKPVGRNASPSYGPQTHTFLCCASIYTFGYACGICRISICLFTFNCRYRSHACWHHSYFMRRIALSYLCAPDTFRLRNMLQYLRPLRMCMGGPFSSHYTVFAYTCSRCLWTMVARQREPYPYTHLPWTV